MGPICYSFNGTIMAANENDSSIYHFTTAGKKIAKLVGHEHVVRTICFSPDGTTLASGSMDKSILIWL